MTNNPDPIEAIDQELNDARTEAIRATGQLGGFTSSIRRALGITGSSDLDVCTAVRDVVQGRNRLQEQLDVANRMIEHQRGAWDDLRADARQRLTQAEDRIRQLEQQLTAAQQQAADPDTDIDELLTNVARSIRHATSNDERAEAVEKLLSSWYTAWPDSAVTDPHAPLAGELVRLLTASGLGSPSRAQEPEPSSAEQGTGSTPPPWYAFSVRTKLLQDTIRGLVPSLSPDQQDEIGWELDRVDQERQKLAGTVQPRNDEAAILRVLDLMGWPDDRAESAHQEGDWQITPAGHYWQLVTELVAAVHGDVQDDEPAPTAAAEDSTS